METKLLLSLIGFFGSFIVIISRKHPLKSLFWFGIFFLFVRKLSFPIIDSLNLSFFIFTILVLINPFIFLDKNNFKEWRIWYLVLLIGFFNALFFGFQKEFFVGTNIFKRSIEWSTNFFAVILVSSSITYYIKTREDLNKLLNLFLFSCLIFSLTAVSSYFGFYDGVIIQGEGAGVIQDYSNNIIYSEIYGISSSNLIFGVSGLGILFLPFLNWKAWKKFLFTTLLAFAVIISFKRIAIVSLVMALIYFLLIEKRRGNNIWLLVIPLLFLTIGTTYYDIISTRFTSISNTLTQSATSDTSTQIRFDRINLAWEIFLENPLLGQGSGYLAFVHNGFLEILGNLGFLGLVLFKPILKPLLTIKRNFYNPWAIALIIFMITLVGLEAAINRIEVMYYLGLLYGGFLVSIKLNKNFSNE